MAKSEFNSSVVSPEHNGAEKVGEHQVIRRSEWVPGNHPEPHKQDEIHSGYIEHYLKCVHCGIEVLNKMDFPDECRD